MYFNLLSGGRPSKFLYAGKNKKNDPWSTNVEDREDGIELSLQPQNKFLKTRDSRISPGTWFVRNLYS